MITSFVATRPDDVVGCLAYKGKPKPLEQMNEAVTRKARKRHARDRYRHHCPLFR
jgi:hypothetical protein